MFDPFDHDHPDPSDAESAFDLGRGLYTVLYAFFAGHFVKPKTFDHQVARWTAIPSILLGPVAIFVLVLSRPSFAMQGVACMGGLVWFCYTAWAIYRVEQAYVKDLEQAQHEEL